MNNDKVYSRKNKTTLCKNMKFMEMNKEAYQEYEIKDRSSHKVEQNGGHWYIEDYVLRTALETSWYQDRI